MECIRGGDNPWASTETSKQTSKQDVLMDGGECLIMDARHAHDFLDKRTMTVLLAFYIF